MWIWALTKCLRKCLNKNNFTFFFCNKKMDDIDIDFVLLFLFVHLIVSNFNLWFYLVTCFMHQGWKSSNKWHWKDNQTKSIIMARNLFLIKTFWSLHFTYFTYMKLKVFADTYIAESFNVHSLEKLWINLHDFNLRGPMKFCSWVWSNNHVVFCIFIWPFWYFFAASSSNSIWPIGWDSF